ncbi:endoglucanase A-like [Babylonia areolata]|uniref:endoglucanase A-like n=1 Tax=Babylonia areolata TaxID=304850 RepID=UPI003FCEEC6D
MLARAILLATLVAVCAASVNFEIVERWWGGFKFRFDLTADQDINSWKLDLHLSGPIDNLQGDWVANIQKAGPNDFTLTNLPSNGHVAAGQTLTNFIVVSCQTECATGHQYTFTVTDGAGGSTSHGGDISQGGGNTGNNNGGGSTGGGGGTGTGTKNYGDALKKSILFYDAQRSGTLPGNNPIHWRGNSAEGDCVNGGWYDAGDHVKFALPFGFATHVLLWGLHKFKDGYQAAGQLDMMYDMIKWATDYMLHAYNPGNHELVAQIGDGNADHAFWGRPEDMRMGRPCYKVGPGRTAADLYGEWAASLAAGYLVWTDKGDSNYANQMLDAAKSMYAFGKSNPGTYTNSVPNVRNFYGSTGYKDELCLGAIWLYKATKEPQYLNDAKGFHEGGVAWALSWDDKRVACQLLLYEETQDASYKNDVAGFVRDYMPGGSVPYTPCGLAWRDKWGANRYAGNAAFVALAAADAGIEPGAGAKWGVEQINYLLGDNHHDGGCYSFEIGYGGKFPHQPHHRGASFCNCNLDGALVGGPDQGGNYNDNREDYVMNEVAIDYNAGFQSALAAINHLKATNAVPATNNKCACR